MRCLITLALLAGAAPAALALDDDTSLVQTGRAMANADETGSATANADEAEEGHWNALSAYGQALEVTVRPVFGEDLRITTRSGMRLQVLMHSVCHKMGLSVGEATFKKESRALDPMSTVKEFGISDGDVIEVSTPALSRKALILKNHTLQEQRVQQAETMLYRKAQELELHEAKKSAKRRRVAQKVARIAADQKRRHQLELKDAITLRFHHPNGGEDVLMGVKISNWLDGYLNLVAKRFKSERARTHFYFRDDEGVLSEIEPHDSVKILGLADDESITVKVL